MKLWNRRRVERAVGPLEIEPQSRVARPSLDEWLAAVDAAFEAERHTDRNNVALFPVSAPRWMPTGARPDSLTA